MRTIEILILVTLFVRLVGYSFPSIRRSFWINLLPSLAALLIVIHLIVEKYRWQMIPVYGATFLLFVLSVPRIKKELQPAGKKAPNRILLTFSFLLRLLLFAMLASLPLLLPVFRLPEPTGSYPIGTTSLHLVDRSRPETFTPAPDDHREFMVKVWYPARVESGVKPDDTIEHLPPLFSHLSLVRTHAYRETPVSDSQNAYPVLIFSHGYIGLVEQNRNLMEELASHGYIVCSIAHTYQAQVTVFPDGRTIPADLALSNDFMKGKSPTYQMYADHLQIWTDDTVFLVDELERVQSGGRESILAGKLDMARLGIFGMSFGGATAFQVCAVDDRCQAGIGLDSGPPKDYAGRVIGAPLKQPFMFMLREYRAYYVRPYLGAVENMAYGVVVRDTTHFDFTDLFLYSPILKFTNSFGSISGRQMITIVNDYTLSFFDKHLKGKISPLLDGPTPVYPQVTIEIQAP